MSDACAVCGRAIATESFTCGTCSQGCWTRWVGSSPHDKAVGLACRDASIYAKVVHSHRPARDVAAESGVSIRTVQHIIQTRRDALAKPGPALVDPAGDPVPTPWRDAVAEFGRPGLVLAANLLLLGAVRYRDRALQRQLGLGEHRLSRMLAEFETVELVRLTLARCATGQLVQVHQLVSPSRWRTPSAG